MINALKKMLGMQPAPDYKQLINDGAVILDVRTKAEYQQGHIRGSMNIPLQLLDHNLSKLNKEKPVITCCASGMRSGSAKMILRSKGFSQVYNGGGWMSLRNKI
jgi:rhodanese-related sulfurtransferase